MPMAYLLINSCEYHPQLIQTLREIEGVEEAYALYGVYDIILRTKADTMNKLKEIHDKIRKLGSVKQTLTMITHEG
jgi:Lrp/AsnC family transcriptional regulator for asnA, asnC and gidA